MSRTARPVVELTDNGCPLTDGELGRPLEEALGHVHEALASRQAVAFNDVGTRWLAPVGTINEFRAQLIAGDTNTATVVGIQVNPSATGEAALAGQSERVRMLAANIERVVELSRDARECMKANACAKLAALGSDAESDEQQVSFVSRALYGTLVYFEIDKSAADVRVSGKITESIKFKTEISASNASVQGGYIGEFFSNGNSIHGPLTTPMLLKYLEDGDFLTMGMEMKAASKSLGMIGLQFETVEGTSCTGS